MKYKLKAQWHSTIHLPTCPKLERIVPSVDKDMELWEQSFISDRVIKFSNHFGKVFKIYWFRLRYIFYNWTIKFPNECICAIR